MKKFASLFCRDTFLVSIGDAVTSIFAGLVIFAILGFMASELSTTVDRVADEGKVFVFHGTSFFFNHEFSTNEIFLA